MLAFSRVLLQKRNQEPAFFHCPHHRSEAHSAQLVHSAKRSDARGVRSLEAGDGFDEGLCCIENSHMVMGSHSIIQHVCFGMFWDNSST